jgi:hypothetical protein
MPAPRPSLPEQHRTTAPQTTTNRSQQDVVEFKGSAPADLQRTGLAFCLNSEVRSLHHRRFLRPLYNRMR